MKQSTTFAQVATNQFDYLSSALCANTPPYKKHSSSRKFLTSSISLRLLLVMFLTLTVSAEVWGETLTLNNLGSSLTSTSNTTISTTTITATGNNKSSYVINYFQCKKQTYSSSHAMLLAKSTSAFISNKTAMPGNIKSVTVYVLTNAASKTTYHCAFSTTECTSAYTTGSTAVNITGESSNKYTCTVSNAKYFCISLGNAYNGQVYKLDVEYEVDTPPSCTTNPTVSAGSHSNITSTTATVSCSGGITSLGSAGCSIESYGFVYGTSSNPTISNTKVQVGTTYITTGTAFSKNFTDLIANTTYYVRPYATNGNGTAYGTQTSFKTLELPKYTVTLVPGSGSVTNTELEGASVDLPTPTLSSACQSEGWTFAGWKTTSAVTTETTTKPTLIAAGTYKPTSNITLYAVYQRTEITQGGESITTVVDNLTHSINGQKSSNTSYVEFSDKTYTSEAKYAGSTSNGNNNNITGVIQIRSNNSNTGIITTASGGKVKKVIVVWDSGTTSGRTLDVYGKNSPYDAVGNLYASDAATKGTKLGSIVCGTSTELIITEDYEYIGLRSASNAMYLTSIAITWESTTGGSTSSTTYYHSTPECTTPCEQLGAATGLTVETNYVHTDGKTYVKFSWTPADNTKNNAASQKLCFGKVGESGTCVDDLANNITWTGDLASKLSAGEYWWSIQALGDGTNYCDGDVVKGSNFTIYSITYNTNGGNTIPATSGTTLPAELPTPTKTGYTFAGWYTNSELTIAATAGAEIIQNTTLYAKWTINQYKVTLNPNYPDEKTGTFTYEEGELVDGNLVLTYDYNTVSKEIESLYTSLSLDGYEFGGWYNAKGLSPGEVSGSKCENTGTITGDKTYYAKWSKFHTITFNTGTNNPTVDAMEGTSETGITLPAGPTPTCTDWTFAGWAEASVAETTTVPTLFLAGSHYKPTSDCTLYAVYSKTEGGGGEELSQTLQYDTWSYYGTTTDKNNYRLFYSGSYIESASFDLSKLSKVVVYGGTFGGDSYNKLTIGDGTNVWKDVTVSGNSQTGINTYTDGNTLSGNGKLRITSNSGSSASGNGVRISKILIYTTTTTITYNSNPSCIPPIEYTITWWANGQQHSSQTAIEGTAIDVPADPEAATYACDDKVFVGWIGQEISGSTDEEPTFITEFGKIESNAIFYAVFATVEGGGETTTKVFSRGEIGKNGNAITTGYVLFAQASAVEGYYQDGSEYNKRYIQVRKSDTSTPIVSSIPSSVTITAKLGGGTPKEDLTNSVYAIWLDKEGKELGTAVLLTDKITETTGSNFTANLPIANATSAYGVRVYHQKESGYNVRYYGISLSYTHNSTSYSDYSTTCDNTKATITYDLNGGTGATCDETTVTKDVEFTLCDQTPTKDGYTFAGWSDGTKTYAAGSSATVSESTTFYAAWTAKTITITWDQNYTDCPGSETSTYIYDGEDIEMPEDPTRSGYQFDGWYTASTDGTKITEVGTTNKPTDDVTYYAHWAELYTVTFMASGQVYVVQEDKYLSGANLELPADPSPANYACDGYIFDGWSVAEKTIEEATKPELITNPTITKDEIYYAVWKKASSTGAGETIFYESFNQYDSPGGNDNNFNTASSDKDNTVSKSDVTGWSGENVYGAKTCIKLGGGSAKGTVTTPALSQLSGSATLSFKAAAWENNSEQTDLVLSITGGGTLDKTSVTMIKGAWKTYEVTIKDGTSATRITFAGKNTSGSRFFLDEVKVTTIGGYNYTTLPSCGPTIVAKEGMWVTSSNGQSVKVNVPIAVKSFTTTATITGTSTSSNFVVTPLENVSNGINDVVEVIYTPTTANTKESTTITLTAKDAETEVSTTTFTLNGRSLPDQFAIVVDKASEYYALPANMPSEGTYIGFGVEVNAGTVIAAPKTHLYTARAVHSTRFTENGTALRLVGNNDACLWASTAKDGTSIRNYANISNATDSQYEWNLYTEDGETYRISCTAVTEEGRILRMYGQKFGMYKSGSDAFHFLPVECTSTPLNVSVSAARTSATISWTNADACNVEVYNGSTKVQTISAAASPVVVSNLAESSAYTFTLTPADNESCVASGAFTTTGPTIDIVEWETNGILIQVDKDNELNPKVVIKGEEEHGNVGGNVADELFFSKYFESHGENKLLAIFNGTTATIDLNGYTIKSENGILDLSQFGQTKGKVASNEEIILVYYDANYSAEECAEEQQGYENWNILTEKGVLAFSGRGSLGLYRNDVLIDVIGSTFPSGELTKIGKSDQGCGTGDDVRLHIDGKSVNDQSSFFCFNGDNIKTDEVETNYALSTNRCLLIRKNTVTSGANAVATNKATAAATCGDLSSTFETLGSEWSGFRIGSGSSSSDEIQDATCDGLGYVGGFDYNNYYRTLETLDNSKTLNEYTRNADENTYFIEIEDLAQYSCLNIQLQLTDNEGNVLTEQTSQVPILVAGEKSTTDEIFSAIVKDSETSEPDYETSKIRCSTCDVVILKNATLTKADAETVNDVNQVRDIYIYPGGKLVVPANATDYSVNNISLRRVQDEVAAADIHASLNITSSSKAPIFIDVRIDANNWHWFALPYDCNIADVSWADGRKAVYNTDWFLMYYDGESRAASTNPHDNHWKVYEGTKIEAGKGYIVGITGDISKPAVKFELRFPMEQDVLTAEQTNKTVALNAWGVKSDNTPNNKGWNLVGNPYLNYYQPKTTGFAGLSLLKYTGIDPLTGDRLYDDNGDIPFLVTPIDGGWYEYRQELASDVEMMPFTAYFVQVGDPDNLDHTDGKELNASFEASNRGKKSILHRAQSEVDELEDPAIVAVSLTNAKGESDKTTLLIADRFTNEYEMNADFFKWFGDYYKYYTKPVLYTIGADQGKRAFNALNEDLASQPISLGMYAAQAGNYTFSLNLRNELAQVQEVWLYDVTQDVYTNLLQDDYTFHTAKTESAGRFFLSVKMAPKVTTDTENLTSGSIWATTHNKTITINGLLSNSNVWVYDATGKLLHADQTQYFQHSFSVPQTGAYFVRVQNTMQTQTIKVVVE
ncbi:MAG: InlB B-repeat-containing protein [Paludibacteraceae bacterium]|nr:InlB B-repeat-containing protein [Paludibacteraceae bacterium]